MKLPFVCPAGELIGHPKPETIKLFSVLVGSKWTIVKKAREASDRGARGVGDEIRYMKPRKRFGTGQKITSLSTNVR